MKKLIALCLLLAVSFGVLYLSGSPEEHYEPEYYFRDNTMQKGEFLWAFCGNGTDAYQQRYFVDQFVSLRTAGVLPAIPAEKLEGIYGCYDAENTLCMIYIGYGDVQAYIYPPETEIWDSYYDVALEDCTKTENSGIFVYGDGTVDGETKALVMTMADGTCCFITGTDYADAADMVLLAEHFANHGIRLDAFDMEKGDFYEQVGLEDPRTMEFAEGCIPEGLEIYDAILELKNGEPNRAVFHYSLGIGKNVTWVVLPGYHSLYNGPDMGDISELSPEVLEEYFGEKYSQAGFWCGDKYVYIIVVHNRLADDLWELIELLGKVE